MGYLVIHPSGKYLRYTCTNTYDKPRLYVNGNYIPLLVKNSGSLTIKGNKNTYKVGELSTYTEVGTLTNVSTLTSESYETRESVSATHAGTSDCVYYWYTYRSVTSHIVDYTIPVTITYTYDPDSPIGSSAPGMQHASSVETGLVEGSSNVLLTSVRASEITRYQASDSMGTTTFTYPINETRVSTSKTVSATYTSGVNTITTGTTYYTRSSIYGSSSSSSSTTYTTSILSTTGGGGIDIGDYPWGQTGISDGNVITYKTYTYSSTFTVQTTSESSTSTSYDLTRSSTSNTVYGTRTTNGTYSVYKTTWV